MWSTLWTASPAEPRRAPPSAPAPAGPSPGRGAAVCASRGGRRAAGRRCPEGLPAGSGRDRTHSTRPLAALRPLRPRAQRASDVGPLARLEPNFASTRGHTGARTLRPSRHCALLGALVASPRRRSRCGSHMAAAACAPCRLPAGLLPGDALAFSLGAAGARTFTCRAPWPRHPSGARGPRTPHCLEPRPAAWYPPMPAPPLHPSTFNRASGLARRRGPWWAAHHPCKEHPLLLFGPCTPACGSLMSAGLTPPRRSLWRSESSRRHAAPCARRLRARRDGTLPLYTGGVAGEARAPAQACCPLQA
jgi:hypothetical protein